MASEATAYAENTAIVDDTIVADFETQDLSGKHHQVLDDADLTISTGCIGYIPEKTIEKMVDASDDHKPWMAHLSYECSPLSQSKKLVRKKDTLQPEAPSGATT